MLEDILIYLPTVGPGHPVQALNFNCFVYQNNKMQTFYILKIEFS